MKILVTGGAGFIGSHVVEAYLAEGHQVRVIDNLATGRRSNVPPAARLHEIDIHSREVDDVFATFRPDVVNHLAAQASVKLSTADPVHDLEVNGGGTARIASLAAAHGVKKMIYASTGGALYGDPDYVPVPETHPIRALSPYGVSKRVGEMYIDLVSRTRGLDYTILRYANAYGPRQDPHGEAGVVAIFTGLMLGGETCTIDGDGEQMKDYVYVGDIARANVLALSKGTGHAINIGTGKGTSVNAIFSALQKATGNASPARHGPARPGDVRNIWLDSTLAGELLGWKHAVEIDEGIRLTVESVRARG
jgi:UDP-glucose 4-epimerase